jgi:hypothetical protein
MGAVAAGVADVRFEVILVCEGRHWRGVRFGEVSPPRIGLAGGGGARIAD